jgi:hypothetical protein
MSIPDSRSSRGGLRRSHQVALVLLGTTGVIGLVAAYDAWRKASAGGVDANASSAPALVPIAADRVYTNNEYIPGVGYYHAPYHAWFPQPFNYHDPMRGYFAGGFWQAVPWIVALSRSQPSGSAVAAAVAAQRQQPEQQTTPTRSYSGGGNGAAGFSSSHPGNSAPAAPRPGIIRGGFGFSAQPGGG